jgi:F420-non-reducing hydrogenase small subunit
MNKSEVKPKLKMAVYWGAACGGCCVSVLDIHEKLFDVVEAADLVFWPIAMDVKYKDVEAMADNSIDITLFNGAIRNSENAHLAALMRKKSKVLIAYGSCSHLGGIPGLANHFSKEQILERAYDGCESTRNPDHIRPALKMEVDGMSLELPAFFNDVYKLSDIVPVEYFIPGCPPQSERLVEVLELVFSGAPLPPIGSVLGARDKTQCEECDRKKSDQKKLNRIIRSHELKDDYTTCFLEQGVVCLGPATRSGCGTRCIKGNAPCRGCYGPAPGVEDPGAKMMSAIATMIGSDSPEEISEVLSGLPDLAGTFYRFSMPSSLLRRTIL